MKNIVIIALSVFVLLLAGTTFYFWRSIQNNLDVMQDNQAELENEFVENIEEEKTTDKNNLVISEKEFKVSSYIKEFDENEKNDLFRITKKAIIEKYGEDDYKDQLPFILLKVNYLYISNEELNNDYSENDEFYLVSGSVCSAEKLKEKENDPYNRIMCSREVIEVIILEQDLSILDISYKKRSVGGWL